MVNNEISLLGLYKTLEDIKKTYGQKINYLSSVFDTKSRLPDGVSNDNDGPGLWPDAGITVYRIIPQHVLAYSFCSSGLIVNMASQAMRFQLMLVEHNDLYPERDGRLYVRHANMPVDAWTDWRLVMNTNDITDLVGGKVKVGNAATADALTTPRSISLGGMLTGTTVFDGSENVVIDVEGGKFCPLNVIHPAKHYESKTALHVLSLPANDGSVHAHAVVFGHIGGWKPEQGQATIHMDVSRRDGDKVNCLVIGTLGNVDVVCADDVTTHELRVYLEFTGYVGACELGVYGDQVTLVDEFQVGTPIYTPFWRASVDAVYVDGTHTNLAPDVTVESAAVAEKIDPRNISSGTHFLATVDADGTVNYHPSMVVNHGTQSITASKFIGNLQGTATSATTAQTANAIMSREMRNTRAPILAGNGMSAIYDNEVYLENQAGVLCATVVRSSEHEVDKITATTGNITTINATNINNSNAITSKTVKATSSMTAPTFIGHLQGNADTATLAATATVTSKNNIKATVVGNVGTSLYADTGVYITTTGGQLHANSFDGSTAALSTVTASTSMTAPKFIGALNGNADTATLAATATVTEATTTKAALVGRVGTKLYSDAGVYLTTTAGQLYANNFYGVSATLTTATASTSMTAPKFIGALNGNADTCTKATTSVVTSSATTKALLTGHVNGALYADSNVYLTTTSGQLHATSFTGTSATLSTVTASTSMTAPKFIGALNGNADTCTKATTAAVTAATTTKATVVGHVNGTLYGDAGVYLTTTSGELHATTLSATTLVGAGAKLSAATPQIAFHYNSASSASMVLKATSASLLTCSSEFSASRVYNAVWNDYAEYFPRGGETEPGDVIALDLAQPGEKYVKAHEGCTCVVGVHSDEYGHIVGGEQPPMGTDFKEYNIIRYIPVALAGRVRVKFVGPAKRGMRVVPAADGAARVFADGDDPSTVIGMLVEDDTRTDLRRLRMKVL